MGTRGKSYTQDYKLDFVKRFELSGQTLKEFVLKEDVSYKSALEWIKKQGKENVLKRHKNGPYTPEERRQAIEAYLKSGLPQEDFCKTWGVSPSTLIGWLKKYKEQGPKGLDGYAPAKSDDKRKGRKISEKVIEEIIKIKKSDPSSGLKYIQQVMARFKGVSVSTGSIKKTLNEAEIPLVKKQKKRRRSADKVRTFERALPMQLWQSDITSYVMTRHSQRVYLTVFMDDYSRFIVSWNLSVRQTTEFVSETLLEGVAKFGKPIEVLTDQGRQYFAWRGKSDFQRILDREGIKHVVSRSHHPQTLGKCERFWETVGQEFWDRVKPQDLSDAKSRFQNYVNHYNHFRPHQGIDGLTPADRFFGVASEVRAALEASMSENQLRIALGDAPRSPVFLIGQIGDQPVSLHGEGGKLVLQTSEGETKEIAYGEFGHLSPKIIKGVDNGREGRSSNEDQTPRPEERLCDAGESSNPGEGFVGISFSGGETDGPQNSSSFDAVLDWESKQDGYCEGFEDTSFADMAALESGASRNDGRTIKAAENEKGSSSNEQGRRSEISQEEDPGVGEDSIFSPTIDSHPEGDAGLSRCHDSVGRSGTGRDGKADD